MDVKLYFLINSLAGGGAQSHQPKPNLLSLSFPTVLFPKALGLPPKSS